MTVLLCFAVPCIIQQKLAHSLTPADICSRCFDIILHLTHQKMENSWPKPTYGWTRSMITSAYDWVMMSKPNTLFGWAPIGLILGGQYYNWMSSDLILEYAPCRYNCVIHAWALWVYLGAKRRYINTLPFLFFFLSKFAHSHYFGYWLLQQLALPCKPWCVEDSLLCWFLVSYFQFVVVWKGQFIESGKPGRLREFYCAKFVSTLQKNIWLLLGCMNVVYSVYADPEYLLQLVI